MRGCPDTHVASWKNLERLELTTPDRVWALPQLPATIRSVEFINGSAGRLINAYKRLADESLRALQYEGDILPYHEPVLPPVMQLGQLEHLCLLGGDVYSSRSHDSPMSLAWFLEHIEPSLSNGTLTSLAISFDLDIRDALDRALNKEAIRTLGFFGFFNSDLISISSDIIANWVAGFPNLTTLGMFPQKFEGCWMIISKVLAMENMIDTIYTNILTGVWRDWVLEKAEAKGVRIIHADRIPEPVLKPLQEEPGE